MNFTFKEFSSMVTHNLYIYKANIRKVDKPIYIDMNKWSKDVGN